MLCNTNAQLGAITCENDPTTMQQSSNCYPKPPQGKQQNKQVTY